MHGLHLVKPVDGWRFLAEGCPKHPAYRAIRPPRLNKRGNIRDYECGHCADLWHTKKELTK